MSDLRPDRAVPPFRPAEIDGVPGLAPDDLAADAQVARELESLAGEAAAKPTGGFVDRVMAAVAVEPAPAPVRTARGAIRRRSLGALIASIADAWRVTTRPGFPMAVRAQAFALVLLVAGLFAGSSLATVGAIGLLEENRGQHPEPSLVAPSQPVDLASPPPTTTNETGPSQPPESTEPAPTEDATAEPTGTPEPEETDDKGGDGGDHHGGSATQAPARTPRPTERSDDHSGSGGGDGGGDDHEDSTQTPRPTETSDDGGSSGSGGSGGDD